MQGLLIAISSSRKYFYIQTPYLLPTEPILMALKTAALAGVDVRIMIPARADTWITHLGSLSYLDDIMRAGVRIYLYQKGFLHSKLMVSDDTLSTVGSTNMDFRSFEHNFEVNAVIAFLCFSAWLTTFFLTKPYSVQMKKIRWDPSEGTASAAPGGNAASAEIHGFQGSRSSKKHGLLRGRGGCKRG